MDRSRALQGRTFRQARDSFEGDSLATRHPAGDPPFTLLPECWRLAAEDDDRHGPPETRMRFRFPFPFGRTALLLLGGLGAPVLGGSASAETLKVHYGVSLIGLPIGSAAVTSHIEPASYSVEANAKLSGLASLLSSSKGAATATGAMSGTHLAPATYATTSSNATMTRTLRMAMNAGTVEGVEITPPFDPQAKRVPVTEADKRNILDPLSAFVMTVPAGAPTVGAEVCNRTLPIFDGATRFDLALSYVGTRQVKARGYDGPVSVCAARYRPISGHRIDAKAAQFMANNKGLEVWLAPVAGTRIAFPFRISVLTMIGTTVIEADDFSVDGSTHAANTAQ
jgi:hypothetical protein